LRPPDLAAETDLRPNIQPDQHLFATYRPILSLLRGTAFLLAASGLHGLLLPLRGQVEGFSTASLGLMGTVVVHRCEVHVRRADDLAHPRARESVPGEHLRSGFDQAPGNVAVLPQPLELHSSNVSLFFVVPASVICFTKSINSCSSMAVDAPIPARPDDQPQEG